MTLGEFWRGQAAAAEAPAPRSVPLWLARLVSPFGARFSADLHVPLDSTSLEAIGWEAKGRAPRG